eukprot:1315773-Pyramimonas_sp.AAC.1
MDSTHNAIEHNRGMAHRKSARRSAPQLPARHIKIYTLSVTLWHVSGHVPWRVPWRVPWHVP